MGVEGLVGFKVFGVSVQSFVFSLKFRTHDLKVLVGFRRPDGVRQARNTGAFLK